MSQASAPLIRIVSRSRLAAAFLQTVLRTDYPEVELFSRGFVSPPCATRQQLFVIDCGNLGIPLGVFVRDLMQKHPEAFFVVVDDAEHERDASFLLSAGIHGFVPQDQVESALGAALERVLAGGVWLPHRVLRGQRAATGKCSSEDRSRLTQREMEVLELVRFRLSNREVATTLRIQESTVKYHIANLFCKLGVKNRTQLVGRNNVASLAQAH